MSEISPGVVGVVPAAGRARRLGSPVASKELSPVYPDPDRPGRTLPVCYRLLHALGEAGIAEATIVLRSDKSDLRERLGADAPTPPLLRLIELAESPSPAYTVAAGTRTAADATIALGFPDVLWEGSRAFARLLAELETSGAAAVLGLFPPAPDYPTHAARVDSRGRVVTLEEAGAGADGPAWTLAVWRPAVSRQLEAMVDARYGTDGTGRSDGAELGLTDVFRRAIDGGLEVRGLEISASPFLDVGTPERLAEAERRAEVARRD